MLNRLIRPVVAAAGLVIASSTALLGQAALERPDARTLPGTESIKAFIASRIQKNWTQPKTPWGDPDISGVFTSKDEANTPFERPEEWAGRKMDDITAKEFAEAVERRLTVALERAPRGVPIHWFDNLQSKNKRPWFLIDPPEGKIPPRVPGAPPEPNVINTQAPPEIVGVDGGLIADTLGRDNAPKDIPANRTLSDRCIASFNGGGIWQLPIIYGNSYQILQHKDHVIMRYEMVHEARMIPLDGRAHGSDAIRGYFGESRGWWDGNTLVVETRNIHERMRFRGATAKDLRMVERFTRISPNQVEWTMTIDNPTLYTRPWTYSYPLTEDNNQHIFEYACHEGNYGMANLLTAGRLQEKAQQQAR
jgi:hypothetical protein